MSEYVPTVGELRQAYVEASGASMAQESYYAEQVAEFERGIARIKAEALREALLSDETVERAARALYETDREEYDGDKPWPPRPHFIEDMYRERARAALTAATGGDDE